MKVFVLVDRSDLRAVQAAFRRLPKGASKSLRERTQELAGLLATRMQASGRADSKQSAAAAKSVRARKDRVPTIVAGGSMRVTSSGAKAHQVLYGSEFGATYWKQFRPHRGRNSYWLFKSFEDNRDLFFRTWQLIALDVAKDWSRGGDV